jgi:hypothetical protein
MKNFLIGLLIGLFFMSLLGTDNSTANGSVTIPTDCVYVVAVSIGTTDAPYLNGNLMQTKDTVAATGQLDAISVHVSTFPTQQSLPFVMNGADRIIWFFLDDAVCTRPVPVSGYSATGEVTGTLDTSTNDIVIGIVLGTNGQVLITGDTVGLTAIYDTTTCRVGHITPGDSSMSCSASDEDVATGYWYYPPAYYTDTSTSVLVEAGHYEFNPVYHYVSYVYIYTSGSSDIFNEYDNGVLTGNIGIMPHGLTPDPYYYYAYPGVWVPDRYETQTSGYWTYPDPVWVTTGDPGEISCIFISIADTMIGSVYVTRPLCC